MDYQLGNDRFFVKNRFVFFFDKKTQKTQCQMTLKISGKSILHMDYQWRNDMFFFHKIDVFR